jgi:chemotaxis protein histidine kinase CheA
LPGGRPPAAKPPFKRGTPRSGVSREEPDEGPKKPKPRQRPVKPPNLEEIKLAAEQSGYTENIYQALVDVSDEPHADEVANYRESRQSRDRFQAEQMAEVGNLVAAMQDLRAAIDSMSSERKKRMSKTLHTLRLRLDSAERELRRRIAA